MSRSSWRVETGYDSVLVWVLPGAVFAFFVAGMAALFFGGFDRDGTWLSHSFWTLFAGVFSWFGWEGTRLLPFRSARVFLDDHGIRIVRKRGTVEYEWREITRVSYHNSLQIVDIYVGKQRVLSLDFWAENFPEFAHVLDHYTEDVRQGPRYRGK